MTNPFFDDTGIVGFDDSNITGFDDTVNKYKQISDKSEKKQNKVALKSKIKKGQRGDLAVFNESDLYDADTFLVGGSNDPNQRLATSLEGTAFDSGERETSYRDRATLSPEDLLRQDKKEFFQRKSFAKRNGIPFEDVTRADIQRQDDKAKEEVISLFKEGFTQLDPEKDTFIGPPTEEEFKRSLAPGEIATERVVVGKDQDGRDLTVLRNPITGKIPADILAANPNLNMAFNAPFNKGGKDAVEAQEDAQYEAEIAKADEDAYITSEMMEDDPSAVSANALVGGLAFGNAGLAKVLKSAPTVVDSILKGQLEVKDVDAYATRKVKEKTKQELTGILKNLEKAETPNENYINHIKQRIGELSFTEREKNLTNRPPLPTAARTKENPNGIIMRQKEAPYDVLEGINQREELFYKPIEEIVEIGLSYFNKSADIEDRKASATADRRTAIHAERAGENIEKGNYATAVADLSKSIGSWGGSVVDTAINRPEVILNTVMTSIPETMMLVAGGPLGAGSYFTDAVRESTKGFVEEHGKNPTTSEMVNIVLLDAVATGAAALGAEVVVKGLPKSARDMISSGVGKLSTKVANKVYSNLPKALQKTIDVASKGAKVTRADILTKVLTSATYRVGLSAVVEPISEVTEDLAKELSVTQDIDKLNFKEKIATARAAALGGAGQTAAISTPQVLASGLTAAATTVGKTAEEVSKGTEVVKGAKKERDQNK
ncbi:MAG: hypothetical protein DRQ47_08665, partial [Gammaproteobacteria bacterium]